MVPPELANQTELLLDTTNAEEVGEKQQVLQVLSPASSCRKPASARHSSIQPVRNAQ